MEEFVLKRYESYGRGIGRRIVKGRADFKELEAWALEHDSPVNESGRQEMLESILNRYVLNRDMG